MKYIEENPDFIKPEPRKKRWLTTSKTRSSRFVRFKKLIYMGRPADFDDGHVIYVWIDALQTTSPPSATLRTKRENCITSTGRQMCI